MIHKIAAVFLLAFWLSSCDSAQTLNRPVPDIQAATRAFRLYYRERVERAVTAYQRYMTFGDVTFAVSLGKAGIARQGNDYEVVPGPNDNNMIGISVWTVWHAYRIFRTRRLELALVRMFNGLHFFEQVSGHPGMTARFVYPGWTRVVDGVSGDVTRTRDGNPVEAAHVYNPELFDEMLETFWDGLRVTYREDPRDILFNYMPAVETDDYAVTYSFSALPGYLRSSDCCASIMRTPAPYDWEGAYWGNHNSRDNFPDLSLGIVAAMGAMGDKSSSKAVRQAAASVVEAGRRIGDLIVDNDALMTVGEHNPYEYLINSGAVRPDGETENEDLGSLADCQMAYLSRAISSGGLGTPLPAVKAPASIEQLLVDAIGQDTNCEVPKGARSCKRLEEAFCGQDWETMEQMEFFGMPWLDLVRDLEESSPGAAENLIGGFQDDFYEITLAVTALVAYADTRPEAELGRQARKVLGDITHLMRVFADIIYTNTQPARLAARLYQAALFEAWAGLSSTPLSELGEHADSEWHMQNLESWLDMEDTQPAPMRTNEDILTAIESRLEGASQSVQQRYQDAYGDTPPVRVEGEEYQARGFPEADYPWRAVERPHHRIVGGSRLLHALPLCITAPGILDCSWAVMGCTRPDLNADGMVDAADTALFESARAEHALDDCRPGNQWCSGADLDRTGRVDQTDAAFLDAAQGCTYASE